MKDTITLSRLKIPVFIGVPDEERAEQQVVEVTLEMSPERPLLGTGDEIDQTINYYEVSKRLIAEAQAKPRKLIEQLNEDLLRMVLGEFPLESATITTYKYILPNTEHVSVSMTLTR